MIEFLVDFIPTGVVADVVAVFLVGFAEELLRRGWVHIRHIRFVIQVITKAIERMPELEREEVRMRVKATVKDGFERDYNKVKDTIEDLKHRDWITKKK